MKSTDWKHPGPYHSLITMKALLVPIRCWLVLLAALAPSIQASAATTINFDLNTTAGGNYTGTGVAADPGTFWNSGIVPANASSFLLASVNNSQGQLMANGLIYLRETAGAPIKGSSTTTGGNPVPLALMQDYTTGGTYEVIVGGLPPGEYILYVFAHGSLPEQNATVTLNAANGGASGLTGTIGDQTRNLLAAGAEGNAYLKFAGVPVASDGILRFSVTNYLNGFQLVDMEVPVIDVQPPATLQVKFGLNATLSVSAHGAASMTYQWQRSIDQGVNYDDIDAAANPSAATPVLELKRVTFADAALYRVVLTASGKSVTSQATALTILDNPGPIFTLEPLSQSVSLGETVVLSAAAIASSGEIEYQWFHDGILIPGATGPDYIIDSFKVSDSGQYAVQASNPEGTITSGPARIMLNLPAFPGADGAAGYVSGGRGGVVYHVTRLDGLFADKDGMVEGTFWYGLNNSHFPSGPRTIVFDVAGTIHMGLPDTGGWTSGGNAWTSESRKSISVNDLTIAGESAPGPVIFMGGTLKPSGRNLIIRNITVAAGYGMKNFWEPGKSLPPQGTLPIAYTMDAFDISGKFILIDHVDAWYGSDETISWNELGENITIQYTSNALAQNFDDHSYGHLLQGDTDFKASFIHNLDAHIRGRLPRIGSEVGTGALNDFRNNVIYNWFSGAGYSGGGQYSKNNFIHNFYLAGQGGDKGWNSTQSGGTGIFSGSNGFTFAFVQGNLKDINKDGDANDAVSADSSFTSTTFQEAAYDIDVGVTLDAEDAFINVLRYAGSRWWDRDYDVTLGNTSAIDTVSERIMHDVIAGTGRINAWSDDPWNDDPAEGAEWRSLWALRPAPDGTAPYNHPAGWDADRDGIPGWWELSHGLNPDAANNNGDFDLDGYTDLEEYLHEVAAWPAPGEIHFTGEQSGRFAEIQNWRVFGLDLNIAGSGIVTTSTYWQPSRYDTAVVNNRTVVVDAAGQNAGTLRLQDGAVLSIEDGWLKASNLEVGDGCSVTVGEGATLRLAGDGAITLGAGATFINNGIVDLISWQGSLPQGFVNNGTIIDRRDVLLISVVAAASRQVELTILAQPGHVYQLESKPSLTAGDWEAAGDAISGTGQPVVLVLPDTDLLQSRFYRVSIR